MRIRLLRLAASACVLLFTTPLLLAQNQPRPVILHFDPEHTQIHWTLGSVLHTVHGSFQLKGGLSGFMPSTGAAEGELLVDLDSGTSGSAARDRKMKKDVLETPTYPEAIYHPEKVSGSLRAGTTQQVTVDGTFTLHGHDHPVSLLVSVQMIDPTHAHLTTRFTVPYVQWGMKDPSTVVLRVSKQVSIDVSADATVENLQP